VRDLSDVIDVRYGVGFGLGASVQFGETFQTSLGCARELYQREWFGRKSVETHDGFFAGGLLYGVEGDGGKYGPRQCCCDGEHDADGARGNTTGGQHLLILGGGAGSRTRTGDEAWFTEPGGDMPILDEFRIGGAVFLPGVLGGACLNVGEAIDFLCGLATFDLMNDDGYSKFFTPPAEAGCEVASIGGGLTRSGTAP
jgi:hypothetical protein